jgi:acyl transferase domain-containing protein
MFWAEHHTSYEYRHLIHVRHDLLDRRILGLSDNNIAWRNVLCLKDVPWLEDHKLGRSIIFPCARHLALAIEAIRQHCDVIGIECIGTTLRNVELKEALVIPPTDAGIEIQVQLTSSSSSKTGITSYSFAVESVSNNGTWTIHCTGTCTAQTVDLEPPSKKHPVNSYDLTQRHSGKIWKEAFQLVGSEYGRQFGALTRIRIHDKYESQAAGKIPIATKSGLIKDESRYFLHPATVDSLLQLIIIAIHGGDYQEMPWGVIPVGIDEVTVRQAGESEGTVGDAVAWLPEGRNDRSRRFVSDGNNLRQVWGSGLGH